jgi:molybdopterin-guanine dinucleotide biosynthesis protein B
LVPAISFVGHHNSGKTTLLVKVIRHLSSWNISTVVIKHSQHGFDLPADKDSERLYQAGSRLVYASSPSMSLRYRRENTERDLSDLYMEVKGYADLVITEGYKTGPYPKIEVVRQATGDLLPNLPHLIARVSDQPINDQTPLFSFDQDLEVARFIVERFHLNCGARHHS